MAEGVEDRLRASGYELPTVPQPGGSYVPAIRAGTLLFTAGQLPFKEGGLLYTGKVGREVSVEDAKEAARRCTLNALAAVKSEVGLENVRRIAKVTGYVASAEGFTGQPEVMNGASDLIGDLFGDSGPHTRTAVGVAELPLNAPVEVELVVELDRG